VSLETATTIAGLVITNPTTGDQVSQADDHLRLIKTVLKAQFPGAGSDGYNIPITATEVELNYVHGVTSAIQTQFNGVVPIGGIIMWNGITAPANWQICDGTNSTPDLRDRFIIGQGAHYAAGATGGSWDTVVVAHTHTATSTGSISLTTGNQGANHVHTFTTNATNTDHTHAYTQNNFTTQEAQNMSHGIAVGSAISTTGAMSQNQTHTHTGTTATESAVHNHAVTGSVTVGTTINSTGITGVNANLPPFYALAYIMRYQ